MSETKRIHAKLYVGGDGEVKGVLKEEVQGNAMPNGLGWRVAEVVEQSQEERAALRALKVWAGRVERSGATKGDGLSSNDDMLMRAAMRMMGKEWE